jgi:hypothetical protein
MFYLFMIEQLGSVIRASIARFSTDVTCDRNDQSHSGKPLDLDDEWMNPWTTQQRLLKEALAQAKERNSSTEKPGVRN